MLVSNPKYRRPISSKQLELLELLYKFRFVTVPLLAEYLEKDRSTVYENLYVLEKQQYVSKVYDGKSYRLPGKPARYFLAAKGIRYLREHTDLNQTVLRNYYKNKSVSEDYVEHCLSVFAVAMAIQSQTNSRFDIFTKAELASYTFFLRPLPDFYLKRKKKQAGKHYDFMLDILDPTKPFWTYKKRMQAYDEHCESKELNRKDKIYPQLLLVAPTERIEKRLQLVMENLYCDFEIYTTTIDRMLDSTNKSKAVWSVLFEEDELYSLSQLPVNP